MFSLHIDLLIIQICTSHIGTKITSKLNCGSNLLRDYTKWYTAMETSKWQILEETYLCIIKIIFKLLYFSYDFKKSLHSIKCFHYSLLLNSAKTIFYRCLQSLFQSVVIKHILMYICQKGGCFETLKRGGWESNTL